MILCADYDKVSCPLECYYADKTETYLRNPYHDSEITATILLGTNICPITNKLTNNNYINKE